MGLNPQRRNAAKIAGALFAAAFFLSPAARAEPIRIVAFGDSNTAGFRLLDKNTYPAQLERALRAKGYDVRVKNSGVSGDTSSMGLKRIGKAVPEGTNIAIVYFGRNDLRWGVAPAKIRARIDAIVKRLRARNIEVLLIGLRTFDLSAIAEQDGALYYPDFFTGVATNGDKDPKYTLVLDPIRHLNTKGYTVVVEHLLPIVESMLQNLGVAPEMPLQHPEAMQAPHPVPPLTVTR